MKSFTGKVKGILATKKPTTEKTNTQPAAVSLYSNQELNVYNRVTNNSNLTHENVDSLMRRAFIRSGITQDEYEGLSRNGQVDICVIGDGGSSLCDAIVKFIGQNPKKDRASFAICRGYRDDSGRISGNTHWTALHLRRSTDREGKDHIHSYYSDSMSDTIHLEVARFLNSDQINQNVSNETRNISEVGKRGLQQLPQIVFEQTKIVRCDIQTDVYSCGYHSVYNLLRMHSAPPAESDIQPQLKITQTEDDGTIREEVVQDFIILRREELKQWFNHEMPLASKTQGGNKSVLDTADNFVDQQIKLILAVIDKGESQAFSDKYYKKIDELVAINQNIIEKRNSLGDQRVVVLNEMIEGSINKLISDYILERRSILFSLGYDVTEEEDDVFKILDRSEFRKGLMKRDSTFLTILYAALQWNLDFINATSKSLELTADEPKFQEGRSEESSAVKPWFVDTYHQSQKIYSSDTENLPISSPIYRGRDFGNKFPFQQTIRGDGACYFNASLAVILNDCVGNDKNWNVLKQGLIDRGLEEIANDICTEGETITRQKISDLLQVRGERNIIKRLSSALIVPMNETFRDDVMRSISKGFDSQSALGTWKEGHPNPELKSLIEKARENNITRAEVEKIRRDLGAAIKEDSSFTLTVDASFEDWLDYDNAATNRYLANRYAEENLRGIVHELYPIKKVVTVTATTSPDLSHNELYISNIGGAAHFNALYSRIDQRFAQDLKDKYPGDLYESYSEKIAEIMMSSDPLMSVGSDQRKSFIESFKNISSEDRIDYSFKNDRRSLSQIAARFGFVELVETFIEGNSVEREQGLLPIHIAASSISDPKELTPYIDNVNVNSVDSNGRTALIYAAMKGSTELVSFLIKKGALPNWTDRDDKSALLYAFDGDHTSTIDLLSGLLEEGKSGSAKEAAVNSLQIPAQAEIIPNKEEGVEGEKEQSAVYRISTLPTLPKENKILKTCSRTDEETENVINFQRPNSENVKVRVFFNVYYPVVQYHDGSNWKEFEDNNERKVSLEDVIAQNKERDSLFTKELQAALNEGEEVTNSDLASLFKQAFEEGYIQASAVIFDKFVAQTADKFDAAALRKFYNVANPLDRSGNVLDRTYEDNLNEPVIDLSQRQELKKRVTKHVKTCNSKHRKNIATSSVPIDAIRMSLETSIGPRRYQAILGILRDDCGISLEGLDEYAGNADKFKRIQFDHEDYKKGEDEKEYNELNQFNQKALELLNKNSGKLWEDLDKLLRSEAYEKDLKRIVEKLHPSDDLTEKIKDHLLAIYSGGAIEEPFNQLKIILISERLKAKMLERDKALDLATRFVVGKESLETLQQDESVQQMGEGKPSEKKFEAIFTKYAAFGKISDSTQLRKRVVGKVLSQFQKKFAEQIHHLDGIQTVEMDGSEILFRGIDQRSDLTEELIRRQFEEVYVGMSTSDGVSQQLSSYKIQRERVPGPGGLQKRASYAAATTFNFAVAAKYAGDRGWIYDVRPKKGKVATNLQVLSPKYQEIDFEAIDPEEIYAVYKVSQTSIDSSNTTTSRKNNKIEKVILNPHYKKRKDDSLNLLVEGQKIVTEESQSMCGGEVFSVTSGVNNSNGVDVFKSFNEQQIKFHRNKYSMGSHLREANSTLMQNKMQNKQPSLLVVGSNYNRSFSGIDAASEVVEKDVAVTDQSDTASQEKSNALWFHYKEGYNSESGSHSRGWFWGNPDNSGDGNNFKVFISVEPDDLNMATEILIKKGYFNYQQLPECSQKIPPYSEGSVGRRLAIILYAQGKKNAESDKIWAERLNAIEKDFYEAGIKPRPLVSKEEAALGSDADDRKFPGSLYSYYKKDVVWNPLPWNWRGDNYFSGIEINVAESIDQKIRVIKSKISEAEEGGNSSELPRLKDMLKAEELYFEISQVGPEGTEYIQSGTNISGEKKTNEVKVTILDSDGSLKEETRKVTLERARYFLANDLRRSANTERQTVHLGNSGNITEQQGVGDGPLISDLGQKDAAEIVDGSHSLQADKDVEIITEGISKQLTPDPTITQSSVGDTNLAEEVIDISSNDPLAFEASIVELEKPVSSDRVEIEESNFSSYLPQVLNDGASRVDEQIEEVSKETVNSGNITEQQDGGDVFLKSLDEPIPMGQNGASLDQIMKEQVGSEQKDAAEIVDGSQSPQQPEGQLLLLKEEEEKSVVDLELLFEDEGQVDQASVRIVPSQQDMEEQFRSLIVGVTREHAFESLVVIEPEDKILLTKKSQILKDKIAEIVPSVARDTKLPETMAEANIKEVIASTSKLQSLKEFTKEAGSQDLKDSKFEGALIRINGQLAKAGKKSNKAIWADLSTADKNAVLDKYDKYAEEGGGEKIEASARKSLVGYRIVRNGKAEKLPTISQQESERLEDVMKFSKDKMKETDIYEINKQKERLRRGNHGSFIRRGLVEERAEEIKKEITTNIVQATSCTSLTSGRKIDATEESSHAIGQRSRSSSSTGSNSHDH